MIISKVSLRRTQGAQGTLAKMLLEGAAGDRGHALIWSLFGAAGDETRSFLYRQIDPGSFITVSPQPPEDAHRLWSIEWKPYAPVLQAGQRLGFVLRANPVVSIKTAQASRGKRVDVVMHAKHKLSRAERAKFEGAEEAALGWLLARGGSLGAAFDPERCSATGYSQIVIRKEGARHPVTFSEIDYEGVLTVTDPEKLTAALFGGIGRARAYGCGLMLVRPAR